MHTVTWPPLKQQTITGIIFTAILGTLWHFLYPWSRQNFLVGFFAPVNESTWEHLKLLFFPMLLFILYQSQRHSYHRRNILSSGFIGILTGLIAIPLFFYGYQAILGESFIVIDIFIFLVSVCLAFTVYYYLRKKAVSVISAKGAYLLMLILTLAFALFSYFPPNIFLFRPPA